MGQGVSASTRQEREKISPTRAGRLLTPSVSFRPWSKPLSKRPKVCRHGPPQQRTLCCAPVAHRTERRIFRLLASVNTAGCFSECNPHRNCAGAQRVSFPGYCRRRHDLGHPVGCRSFWIHGNSLGVPPESKELLLRSPFEFEHQAIVTSLALPGSE